MSKILFKLSKLEDDRKIQFSLVILTDYIQLQDYINSNPKADFDIILLNRDCKLGGSFHILDIERFGVDKIISISSMPKYNYELRQKGVTKIVLKDYQNLDKFADDVVKLVERFI